MKSNGKSRAVCTRLYLSQNKDGKREGRLTESFMFVAKRTMMNLIALYYQTQTRTHPSGSLQHTHTHAHPTHINTQTPHQLSWVIPFNLGLKLTFSIQAPSHWDEASKAHQVSHLKSAVSVFVCVSVCLCVWVCVRSTWTITNILTLDKTCASSTIKDDMNYCKSKKADVSGVYVFLL